jgi:hypothetical protein
MEVELIERARRFNRTVTQRVGALNDRYLARDRPLGEARLLWEIGEELGHMDDHIHGMAYFDEQIEPPEDEPLDS